jgi:exopolysaccharide production protein ExoY
MNHGLANITLIDLGAPQSPPYMGAYQKIGKRLFDVLFSSVAGVIIAPIILFLALIVKRDGGPMIFKHKRIGLDGKEFYCLKIRTMKPNADHSLQALLSKDLIAAKEWAKTHKLRNDPRITRVGKFLRQTSLDELPQFWNVLKGEMSLVGPRPITGEELHKYGRDKFYYLNSVPGITGIWQVSGRNTTSYSDRVNMDKAYYKTVSFTGDLKLLFQTISTVLKRTGF